MVGQGRLRPGRDERVAARNSAVVQRSDAAGEVLTRQRERRLLEAEEEVQHGHRDGVDDGAVAVGEACSCATSSHSSASPKRMLVAVAALDTLKSARAHDVVDDARASARALLLAILEAPVRE